MYLCYTTKKNSKIKDTHETSFSYGSPEMKDVAVTLHKSTVKRIKELSKLTGTSFSSILGQCVRRGLYDLVEDEI